MSLSQLIYPFQAESKVDQPSQCIHKKNLPNCWQQMDNAHTVGICYLLCFCNIYIIVAYRTMSFSYPLSSVCLRAHQDKQNIPCSLSSLLQFIAAACTCQSLHTLFPHKQISLLLDHCNCIQGLKLIHHNPLTASVQDTPEFYGHHTGPKLVSSATVATILFLPPNPLISHHLLSDLIDHPFNTFLQAQED